MALKSFVHLNNFKAVEREKKEKKEEEKKEREKRKKRAGTPVGR